MHSFSRYSDAPETSEPEDATHSSAVRRKRRKRAPLWVAIPLAILALLFGGSKIISALNFIKAENELSEIPRVVEVSSNRQAAIVTVEDMGADLIRDVLAEWRSHGRVMNSYALTITLPGGAGTDDESFLVSFTDPAIPNQSTLEAIEELAQADRPGGAGLFFSPSKVWGSVSHNVDTSVDWYPQLIRDLELLATLESPSLSRFVNSEGSVELHVFIDGVSKFSLDRAIAGTIDDPGWAQVILNIVNLNYHLDAVGPAYSACRLKEGPLVECELPAGQLADAPQQLLTDLEQEVLALGGTFETS